jgi:hypothetical protein
MSAFPEIRILLVEDMSLKRASPTNSVQQSSTERCLKLKLPITLIMIVGAMTIADLVLRGTFAISTWDRDDA